MDCSKSPIAGSKSCYLSSAFGLQSIRFLRLVDWSIIKQYITTGNDIAMKYSDFRHWCTEFLLEFGMHSDHCVELLAMICAHESLGGKHRRQVGGGPALGVYQMEPATHDSIWGHSDTIHGKALKLGIKRDLSKLEFDDRYSTFVARCKIAMDPNKLPSSQSEMAAWCKKNWNTKNGKATESKYLNDYLSWKSESS